MDRMHSKKGTQINLLQRVLQVLLVVAVAVLVNVGLSYSTTGLNLPIHLDTIGTVAVAVFCGFLPGTMAAVLTSVLEGFLEPMAIYRVLPYVLIASFSVYCVRKKWFAKAWFMVPYVLALAVLSNGRGAVLLALVDAVKGELVLPDLWILVFDLIDKAIVAILVWLFYTFASQGLKKKLRFEGWQQTPLNEENRVEAENVSCRKISLRKKIMILLTVACVSVAIAAFIISMILYRNSIIGQQSELAVGVSHVVAGNIDPEMVDRYLEEGEAAPGYSETEARLHEIKCSAENIQYVYVYQIREDGCHVVFDLDSGEVLGADPGTVTSFDESFAPYIDDLLAGRPIDVIISNDTYGWLLTSYCPIYDSEGRCVCYAAVDISMHRLASEQVTFLLKYIILFLGFYIFVFAIGEWISVYNIVYPINTMAINAGKFAYNSEEERESNVESIRGLRITTGDEVENLYLATVKTTEDSMQYVEDLARKSEELTQMQSGLILVLADVVESRDQETGDHIKKTAAYTRIIMEKMKELGYYTEMLTDKFMDDVEHSAPLHDIGKIEVSDVILNKPGRLTEKEFETMKLHTIYGGQLIRKAISMVPNSGYLAEAYNLAEYHHEKWNGKGYPHGLSGEEIPLSARIMAVADVFDALVSERCYKKAFEFEKAMSIIREDAGSHFDPLVADAFLQSETRVREVAEAFKDRGEKKAKDSKGANGSETEDKSSENKKEEKDSENKKDI